MRCVLSDRLYVPEACVTPESLNEFVYHIEQQEGVYDFGPFETSTGSIRTFAKVRSGNDLYYAFSRGNIEKLGRLFGDIPWDDRTSVTPMQADLKFKGQLYTWETKQIGQQEAVDIWMKRKGGIIKAPPRFGKCCVGDTIIHTPTFGSISIRHLFNHDHKDGECVPAKVALSTKDGIQSTSMLYKKVVDQTIRITTKSGFSIEATPNHPLFIKEGNKFDWKIMSDIKLGDVVALQSDTAVFSKKKSKYFFLYAKYIKTGRKYSEQITKRMLKYDEETQKSFLNALIQNGSIELENQKVLALLQIMLLNHGYLSHMEGI